jgi:ribonuclease HI
MITIYTDGSALGNPGPGGVLEIKRKKFQKDTVILPIIEWSY